MCTCFEFKKNKPIGGGSRIKIQYKTITFSNKPITWQEESYEQKTQ